MNHDRHIFAESLRGSVRQRSRDLAREPAAGRQDRGGEPEVVGDAGGHPRTLRGRRRAQEGKDRRTRTGGRNLLPF